MKGFVSIILVLTVLAVVAVASPSNPLTMNDVNATHNGYNGANLPLEPYTVCDTLDAKQTSLNGRINTMLTKAGWYYAQTHSATYTVDTRLSDLRVQHTEYYNTTDDDADMALDSAINSFYTLYSNGYNGSGGPGKVMTDFNTANSVHTGGHMATMFPPLEQYKINNAWNGFVDARTRYEALETPLATLQGYLDYMDLNYILIRADVNFMVNETGCTLGLMPACPY